MTINPRSSTKKKLDFCQVEITDVTQNATHSPYIPRTRLRIGQYKASFKKMVEISNSKPETNNNYQTISKTSNDALSGVIKDAATNDLSKTHTRA